MKKIKSWRSISFLLWIVVTILMITTMPNMDRLVKEKGQISIPKTAQSFKADQMLKGMNKKDGETYGIIAVFNSGSNKALTKEQKKQVSSIIEELKSKKTKLGITEITSHLDSKEIKEQLVSKDKTTILTQISVDKTHGTISKVSGELNNIIKNKEVKTYLTGSELVSNDFMNSSQDGVKKTETIAVIFILVVLIIVFQSPIVPIVSLLTVGISYLVSMGVISQLVDKLNFPFSNFTQVFVVVVLFGVGTDYNILLYTRFKEELSKQKDALVASKVTFKSAGKTVLYSGIAVLIGFCSLILANFKLYQATSAVAIGVMVLLLVLTTLNPFFMVLLGKGMFYPIKNFKGHGNSGLWGNLSNFSVTRPFISLILIVAITIPFILHYSGSLNFNDLWEVNNKYESKQGINTIEKHYPSGFSSPATLVIQSKKPMDNATALQAIDELTEKISKINGVSKVLSPTRPVGKKITKLYINDQANTLGAGLGNANDGVNKINNGLSSAKDQMKNNDSNGLSNVQKLIDGTTQAENGVTALTSAMNQVTTGIKSSAEGTQKMKDRLTKLDKNMITLSSATDQLYGGYSQLEKGLSFYSQYFKLISDTIAGAKGGYQQIEGLMNNLTMTNPELADDPNVLGTIEIAKAAETQLDELSKQLNTLSMQHQSAMTSFKEANDSLLKVNTGLTQMKSGINALEKGTNELKNGLNKGADGSQLIATKSKEVSSGLSQINNGQKELLNGLNDLQDKMKDLQTGLSQSTKGLDKVSNGLTDAESYLNELSKSKSSEKFYIPNDTLKDKDFQKVLNTYMSDDRKMTKITIILNVNPYSKEAMPIIKKIDSQVEASINGTVLEKAKVAIGGTSSRNADLQEISQQDFLRTATIMLIGIAFVLTIITRSLWNSLFIVGSLVLVYFSSLGISELISTHLLHADLLSWNVPFFSFIMIVALGVDYSIFLMMRYNEQKGGMGARIVEASKHIGGVVLSAALILGGTFAALIPSGVLTLIQVATVVIVALILLSIIAMPVLLPALMKLNDKIKNLKNDA